EPIPGSDLLILDTIADDFNLLAAVEWADLVRRTEETIIELSYQYPQRGYLKLWEGLKQGTTETQLASEWQCCQGTISKRKKELCQRVAERLGLL
ncbi:MAG TPA: sigma-70 family RNA polymerase sigma factor, partial [Allocoleopsis sp.]